MAEVGSKASNAENPCFEDVVGSGPAQEALSGVGKAPLEEGEEEEDPDTHFKWKRKEPKPKKLTRKEPTRKDPRKK